MKLLKKITFIFAFICFATSSINAQNGNNSRKTRVTKNTKKVSVFKDGNRRVSSKTVNYKRPKRKVVSQRALPQRSVIKHKGANYYYSNNRFYTYSRGRYIAIPPKVGFRVRNLPVGHVRVRHPNRNYFWFNGIFYISNNNEYEVVEPELGTVVYQLPGEVERVQINGYTYYEFSNVLYERVQVNGTRAYEVVGFIDQ